MSVVSASTDEKQRDFVLDRFAPYRIVALGHAISKRLSSVYADENITIPEWRVLAVISQGDSLAARDVVARTPMDKMSVSRAAASLESKNLVVRETDENDRRVTMLSLSSAGRALFDRIAGLALQMEDELMETLSTEERDFFQSTLLKLEARAKASNDDRND